ncbi:hypothetical protein [Microvirga guangxiensis]|uniref:hypothetical protein n=1 Tax=Microvirga guangxiensis TaxID=549386 RepID=UPI001AEC7F8B|nr:hypothetical protein [Microvirga guangxiensis]
MRLIFRPNFLLVILGMVHIVVLGDHLWSSKPARFCEAHSSQSETGKLQEMPSLERPTKMIDTQARLEANSLIDCLVADGDKFPADAARRLIDLIPVAPRARVSFIGRFSGKGPDVKGHAAGIGDVKLEGDRTEKSLTLNTPQSHKIGGYTVTHTPGQIRIELMWAETKPDQTGQSCSLEYDPVTRHPKAMQIATQKTLTFLFLSFGYVTYVSWKTPESACSTLYG